MTITPMMQYIQDRILEAVHWCSLEEAREREKQIEWCLVTVCFTVWMSLVEHMVTYDEEKYWDKVHKIIGLKPSLAKVLTALGDEYHRGKIKDHYWERIWIIHTSQYWAVICSARRKLLNEDKSEASLFDQSQETITAIWVLLGRKDENN